MPPLRIEDSLFASVVGYYQPIVIKENQMKRSALIAALLALSLSACGEKAAAPAAVEAAPAPAAAAPAADAAAPAAAPAAK